MIAMPRWTTRISAGHGRGGARPLRGAGGARRTGASRAAVPVLVLALAVFLALTPAATAQSRVAAVRAVGMTVSDADRSSEFFTAVLGFEKVSDIEVWGEPYEHLEGVFGLRMRVVGLRLGSERLELTEYLTPQGRPIPVDTRGNDRWFQHIAIVVADMDAAYRRLREHKVRHASTGPQRLPDWNPNAGGIEAFYFRDPDGHFLELIRFPPGKGDPRWQTLASDGSDRLFLGIDHTAITVADTETSLHFYADLLGLQIAGGAENWGTEQEHLNNVFGARLRITALRAPGGGPGIELLEYLAPSGGRPTPADLQSNDLAHWQTTLAIPDLDAAWSTLKQTPTTFVSPGPVTLPGAVLGFADGLLIRDPDGHAMLLAKP